MLTIALTDSAAADSLAEHLRRCGCIVGRVDETTLEAAAAPRSLDADLDQAEVKAYLRAWQELHSETDIARVVEELRSVPH